MCPIGIVGARFALAGESTVGNETAERFIYAGADCHVNL
jgi:hypothetical protein